VEDFNAKELTSALCDGGAGVMRDSSAESAKSQHHMATRQRKRGSAVGTNPAFAIGLSRALLKIGVAGHFTLAQGKQKQTSKLALLTGSNFGACGWRQSGLQFSGATGASGFGRELKN
jgi:hypothetical protein